MKNYTITVNGNVYDVTVEENGSVSAPASAPRKAAPVAAPKAAAPAPAASTGAGSIKIEAGAAGKVFKLEKKVGDKVALLPIRTARSKIFSAILPVYLILSFLFSGVLMDLTNFGTALRTLSRLFPPSMF